MSIFLLVYLYSSPPDPFKAAAPNSITATFSLQNSGDLAGAEVAQLYLAFPAAAGEPPSQLRAFKKVSLGAGQSTLVTFTLSSRDISIWDVAQHNWAPQSGIFGVAVGASSRDIRLRQQIQL